MIPISTTQFFLVMGVVNQLILWGPCNWVSIVFLQGNHIEFGTVWRYQWLSSERFAELFAMANCLPGPSSTQVAFALGITQGAELRHKLRHEAYTYNGYIYIYLFCMYTYRYVHIFMMMMMIHMHCTLIYIYTMYTRYY
jgi:hypothetical protein